MQLGLETTSFLLAFASGAMNIFSCIDKVHRLGLNGIQINTIRGKYLGHLGGDETGYLRKIHTLTRKLGMFVEVSTQGTNPGHLSRMLSLCDAIGADVLRTFVSLGGDINQELEAAVYDLREIAPLAGKLGIRIAVENHEYETADDMIGLIEEIGSRWVGLLVDTGNSMMVWEDPVTAVRKMAPYAVSTHFKDHAVIMENGQPRVVGVPLGKGSVDCTECFRILADHRQLDRIILEESYGYSAPFRRPQPSGAGGNLGEGAFRIQMPPYDPSVIAPHLFARPQDGSEQEIQWQQSCVRESVRRLTALNRRFG